MYRWLAWAYTYQGKAGEKENPTAAAEDFKKGMENSKNFLEKRGETKVIITDYDNYMQCAFKTKDFETATKLSKDVLALDSTRTDVYETIAKGYYDAAQYDKATEAYATKMAKTKATTTDYFYVGQSYMALKKYPEAETAFGKLTDMSPTYLFAWAQRAKIAEIGDPELKTGAAKPFHEKVLELAKADETKNKPQLIKSNYFLGACNAFLTNDYPKALTYFNEVLRLDPANTDAQTAIASLQSNMATPAGNK
jgi:tetratricopeptide (TPR) repeat protein